MTSILPTPVTMGSATPTTVSDIPATPTTVSDIPATPITVSDTPVTITPTAQADTDLVEPAPEPVMPEPIAEVPMQQAHVDSKLGGSYITNMQTQNEGNASICSLDSVAHKYLKNHFNERLNDKVYETFKELFGNINTDSTREALPKVSVYNNIIAKYVEEINLKYGTELSFTQIEAREVSTWVETFQIATISKDQPNEQQHLQAPYIQQTQDTQ